MSDAKKVALLPAAGPQTLDYIHTQCGPLPPLPLNFEQLNAHLPYDTEAIMPHLERAFSTPEYHAADQILIPNITLLNLLPHLEQMGLATSKCQSYTTNALHNKTVALIGSKYTIANEGLLPNTTRVPLNRPTIEQLEQLRHTYYASQDPNLASKVYKNLCTIQADYYVIACSELSVALAPYDFQGRKYDLLSQIIPKLT